MKLKSFFLAFTMIMVMSALFYSCKKDTTTNPSSSSSNSDKTEAPDVYKKIYGASDIYVEDGFVVIKVNGRPDHKSPYYSGTQWSSTLYEDYITGGGTNSSWNQNPNKIGTQNYTYKIPLNPTAATNHVATNLGSIGVALNGVAFYNQYAGPSQPLTTEINSFDQYGGHPDQSNTYHYHVEPTYLTGLYGKSTLLGFLLDGFPVYGPQESGNTLVSSDLDAYHGHTHATADYPNGIYHYHITSDSPYINGNGYYGTAGTATK